MKTESVIARVYGTKGGRGWVKMPPPQEDPAADLLGEGPVRLVMSEDGRIKVLDQIPIQHGGHVCFIRFIKGGETFRQFTVGDFKSDPADILLDNAQVAPPATLEILQLSVFPEAALKDPMEQIIASALTAAGLVFTDDPRETSGLDFRLGAVPVHIEIKQMHSPRIAEQMSRVEDVIVAQGRRAVDWLAALIEDGTPETPKIDLAYSQINALGGTVQDTDLHGKGYCQAIDDVLTILTRLGGKDAPYKALVRASEIKRTPFVDRMVPGRLVSDEEEDRLRAEDDILMPGGFP